MDLQARVEIHFYDMNEVGIYFESPNVGREEGFAALVVCAFFAMRQAANLGGMQGTSIGMALADWNNNLMRFVRTGEGKPGMPTPKLVPFRGTGRYSFSAQSRFPKPVRFKMHPHGFGFFARGVGYYAPVSVLALFNYLADKFSASTDLLVRLSNLAGSASDILQSGNVRVLNQHKAVEACLSVVWAPGEESAKEGE